MATKICPQSPPLSERVLGTGIRTSEADIFLPQLPLRYSVGLEVLNPPTELPPRFDHFFGCGYILCNLLV